MRTLGLDLSTQSLTAVVVDTELGAVLAVESVRFGQDLPSYESPNGFLLGTGPAVRHANPLLWVDALDVLFARLRAGKVELASIAGVAACAQQHGTVYLARSFNDVKRWDATASLRAQVQPLLSRATAPLWMDTSAALECAEIASAAGGDASIVARTGSRMTPRFAAPQIRKFHKEAPEDYAATREIHLVSSFLTSLLIGRTAPLEPGDAAGMNLLELGTGQFAAELLAATAPELESRLPPVVPSQTVVGTLAPYFTERYGFGADVPVLAGTGDNPASLVGMGATTPGSVVVSLGTSDTLFAPMSEPHTDPGGYGHVFGNPLGGFMGLVCFANGSLAREEVAARTGLDWEAFRRALLATRPGNGGRLLLPYFVPELTPRIAVPAVRLFGPPAFVRFEEPREAARAVVEAQALTMQHHSAWMGAKPARLLLTGGASQNDGILQVFADVFEAEVVPLTLPNAAALGSALRIAHALGEPLERVVAQFAVADDARARAPAQGGTYAELRDRFVSELARLLAEDPHGRPLLSAREAAELGTAVSPSGRELGLPGLSEP